MSAALNGGKPSPYRKVTNIYTIDHPAGGFLVEVNNWSMWSAIYSDATVAKARSGPKGPKPMTVTAEDSILR